MTRLLLCLLFLCGLSTATAQKFNIRITPLDSQFYVHTSYKKLGNDVIPSNGLIVDTPEGVLVVDATWDKRQARQLLRWIKKHLKHKVFLCIISHSHDDRIGGIEAFLDAKIEVGSTAETARRAVADGFPSPSLVFKNDDRFGIGMGSPVEVRTFFPGAGHTPDNIVVWFPKQRVLFGGCFVKSVDALDLGNIKEADLAEWPKSIRYVMETCPDPRWIIPGHFGWDKPGALEHTLKLLDHIH